MASIEESENEKIRSFGFLFIVFGLFRVGLFPPWPKLHVRTKSKLLFFNFREL